MLVFLVLKFQAGHGINYVLFDISKPIIGIFLNASMLFIYFFLNFKQVMASHMSYKLYGRSLFLFEISKPIILIF